jgi:hypothetical protein
LKKIINTYRPWLLGLMLSLSLSACVAPMLLLSPQGQLMWALLKPLVGLDPKTANLFEQPLLKGRLQALLGDNYDTAVSLLNTANKIQQEGPLFYVVSNYTPVPQLAEKAGFVWNAETNQMAVLLVSGGAPLVFAEQLNQQAAKVIPSWPAELVDYTDPVKLKQMALTKAAGSAATGLGLSENQTALVTTAATGGDVKAWAVTQATDTATEKVSSGLGLSENQTALVKTAATGGDVKALAVTQATDVATDKASSGLGLSENQTALVKTAASGGDVKALAMTQATDAATDKASTSLGLSENQTALVKTAATGGDVKALAVTQATTAATEKVTQEATSKASSELGLTSEQADVAAQLAKGSSVSELSEKYQQQSVAEQVEQQKQQLATEVAEKASEKTEKAAKDALPPEVTAAKQSSIDNATSVAKNVDAASNISSQTIATAPAGVNNTQPSLAELTAQLTLASEQEMAAEMALEQAEAKMNSAEMQLSTAKTGAQQAAANTTLVQAQAEHQAASNTLAEAQQKVQQLQQQIKRFKSTTEEPATKTTEKPAESTPPQP